MVASWRAQAVLLDMDGTLLDTESVYFRSALVALEALGHPDAVAICHSIVGLTGAGAEVLLKAEYGAGFPMAAFRQSFQRHKAELMADGPPLKAGAVELLDGLRGARLPVALATSSNRETAHHHLGHVGILGYFDAVVTRDDVLLTKPAPDIYLFAASTLGFAPGLCVAVEDSNPGIAAAHAAGTIPVMVPDVVPPTTESRARSAAIVPDLHAVLALLRKRNVLAG